MSDVSGLTILLLLHLIIAVAVCAHILLTKTETAAPAWIAVVVVSPFIGALLYWVLGINRVQRRARRFRGRKARYVPQLKDLALPFPDLPTHQQRQIFQFESAVHDAPFLGGNSVTPLIGADEVFPDMIRSIGAAKTCIALSVYIFDCDDIGQKVADALKEAYTRGVAVYVLVDEIGSGDKSRAADVKLAAAGIPTARFIPQRLKFLPIVNLRNHRKIMILDANVGYIGGMNICRNYSPRSTETVRDVHFRVTGPVLDQMTAVFEEDWRFATGQSLQLPLAVFNEADLRAPQYARVVPDGPDNPFQRTQWIMLGALALAQRSVHIVTPYFLPNEILAHALSICCLRGVDVRVIVPARTDVRLMDWAMRAKFQELIEHGVKIYLGGRPFDHSKLLTVDGIWSLVGSSNWDQRSLRLNFEANLECYDANLAERLEQHFHGLLEQSDLVSLKKVQSERNITRLRNNIARLFMPYL